MPHVGVEVTILLPLLILQILAFPFAADAVTSIWADSRRKAALQNAGNHLGSTIQQLYFILCDEEISTGVIIQASNVPPTIESYKYLATCSLEAPQNPNSSKILVISLLIPDTGTEATVKITLGPNATWKDSLFESTSPEASIKVEKFADGILQFSFGGN